MSKVKFSIEGLQKAQRANLQMLAALKPSGALGRAVRDATLAAHRYAVPSTPHDYGALRAAERTEVKGVEGRDFIDPAAVAPRSQERPAVYGYRLHQQGRIPGVRSGWRDFFRYTVDTYGDKIVRAGGGQVRAALP